MPATNAPHRTWLALWVVLATLVEFAGGLMTLCGWNNVLLYDLYWPVEFVVLLAMADAIAGRASPWTIAAVAVFFLLWVAEVVSLWNTNKFVTYSFMAGALWLVGRYLLLLWRLVNNLVGPLYRSPVFWTCLSVLLFFGATAPLLGSVNYFIGTDLHLAQQLYWGVRALCLLKFVLMGVTCLRVQPTIAAMP